MTLLHISASPRGNQSESLALARIVHNGDVVAAPSTGVLIRGFIVGGRG